MALVQTQTITPRQLSNPIAVIRVSGRISKAQPPRSTRTNKALLSHSPQIPTAHPDINITLLRNKLLLQCRPYIPSSLLSLALEDGIYSRATHWITPSSQSASKFGKRKRYFVLHTATFSFESTASAWEARILSGGSQPIDAGNGVVVFVKERREWEGFMRGYRRQGRRAGELMGTRQREMERGWRDAWRARCGLGVEGGKKEGPMWVLVKSAVGKIVKGEA
ncbi:hypothetical protein EJ02DRAFT_460710 [Clathrospora elynae]|uniref:Uncharacterized protein n=1 Tax=Clathrospora elynae TaxID=706981 RepID=A0A6A5S9G4_9PLEO|nr:hypothetical protein EJ02DRAFT_460710 [Clathrospora elynae]